MRKVILIVLFAVIFFVVAGCGPGQPFEIESRNAPNSETPIQVAAIR